MEIPVPARWVRFGAFEADLHSGELHKHGHRIKLQDQPFKILVLLLERPGALVTREELRQTLWPADTFVDFDVGLNTAIKRLREALADSAESPRYIETLPRKGYRFIAAVENTSSAPYHNLTIHTQHTAEQPMIAPAVRRLAKLWIVPGVLGATLAVLVGLNIGGLQQRFLRTSGARRTQSIAVLPLENLSGDPAQEYFADGMTEALITDLGKIGELRVISRTSVMRYKGTKKSLQEIAQELQVDALLEGTVARSGDHVRITANLVQASPEKHLWADSFERDLHDVLALQDDVSRAIVNGIQIRLTPQEEVRLANAHRVNREAYQSYLKALYFWGRGTPDGAESAIKYFQASIDEDPQYAPAYAGLAESYLYPQLLRDISLEEARPRAKAAAIKAVKLDDSSAEAHMALANVAEQDWDWLGAQREYRRAIELDPNLALARLGNGFLLLILRKPEDAWTELRTAQSLDPLSLTTGQVLVLSLYYSRKYDEAITTARQWLELYPDSPELHNRLGESYFQKGMGALALAEYLKAEELFGSEPSRIAALQRASRTSGLTGFWKKKLALDQDPASSGFSMYDVAYDYANLRDRDNCLFWLAKSDNEKWRLIELSLEPRFDFLRSDPRFQGLLSRIGLPP